MTINSKLLMRSAIAIAEQIRPRKSATFEHKLPNATWQLCQTRLSQYQRATEREWLHAADIIRQDLRRSLERLHGELSVFGGRLEPPHHDSTTRATARDIYADLLALHDEFVQAEIDRQEQTVSVTTESIVLKEIYLGPFKIQLDWSALGIGNAGSYRIIAQDAQPAATNDSVTHPHVQDEGLCEGEGRKPIRSALEQGRILDFFLIVANLLRTYNAGSPYVALSDWHGHSCADCGSSVSSDDIWSCEKCNTQICGDCYVSCAHCDGIYCGECTSCCAVCDERCCDSCMEVCSGCQTELCRTCLQENERCKDCYEEEAAEIQAQPMDAECEAGAAVQSDRLGQTSVLT